MDHAEILLAAPLLDEHDTAAVVAILIRAVRIQDQLRRDNDLITDARARIATATAERVQGIQALGLFGFAQADDNVWDRVRQSIGSQTYERAVMIARGIDPGTLLSGMVDGGVARLPDQSVTVDATTGGPDGKTPCGSNQVQDQPAPRIKDAILAYLQSLNGRGAGVAQIKQHLLDGYQMTTHQKTPGMTLYRLLKEGLVRREGRMWFAKDREENNENEAPSGNATGASETALAAP